jgi:ATP-binding protein involved in chromosome partitioning
LNKLNCDVSIAITTNFFIRVISKIQKALKGPYMPLPLYGKKEQNSVRLHPLAGIKKIIAIAAGKGGVGKSSVTVQLSHALQFLGYQVGIMDVDIYGPSIRKMLPEDKLPTQIGEIIQPADCRGIRMISMAYFRKENEAAAVRAPIANSLVSHFINNVEWGELDFLLIDFPPGTGDIQLTLSQKAHLSGAIMVTTPQEVALLDVRKAMSLFEQVKVPIIGVLENMSYYQSSANDEPVYIFGKNGGEKLANEAKTAFLGQIPLDPFLCSCGDLGQSLFKEDPSLERPVTRAFKELAHQVVIQMNLPKEKKGIGSFELVWKEMS